MLDTLITSKTRNKLLLKFFLNSNTESYLRNLETEFGESTNAIRIELNRFEKAGLLNSKKEGNKKLFSANTKHPLFPEINKIIYKHVGIDTIVDKVVRNIGEIKSVFVIGSFAEGLNSEILELVVVGRTIDQDYLKSLVDKAEKLINRKVSYSIFEHEADDSLKRVLEYKKSLLIWKS